MTESAVPVPPVPDEARGVFGAALPLVLPTTSRDVMRAGPDPQRLRAAARAVVESVAGLR